MRKIGILLMTCCMLMACKKGTVDFTYTPTAPRSGETVKFSNLSSSGEDWAWTFGDGVTSTLKSPSHTYKQPGTYLVTLQVDNKSAAKVSHSVEVLDTIPGIACADSVFSIYQDYTFTAQVYNPYNYEAKYQWEIVPQSVQADGDTTSSSLKLYFLQPTVYYVGLQVILNTDTTFTQMEIVVSDRATNSLLIRTEANDYRQRIFGSKMEDPKIDESATPLLDAEQDTLQEYNGYTFRLSELQTIVPEMQGFHIINRKLYYRASGLWVANIDGTCPVQIDSLECAAMTLDQTDNRICWANAEGVWTMPFIGSDNNHFVTVPTQLNTLNQVTRLAADEEKK